LYPALHKLEAILDGDWKVDNRMRKYYKLTEAGTETVNRLAELEDFIRTCKV
jgi:DNA-binding PadR family transcriptional regulator